MAVPPVPDMLMALQEIQAKQDALAKLLADQKAPAPPAPAGPGDGDGAEAKEKNHKLIARAHAEFNAADPPFDLKTERKSQANVAARTAAVIKMRDDSWNEKQARHALHQYFKSQKAAQSAKARGTYAKRKAAAKARGYPRRVKLFLQFSQ